MTKRAAICIGVDRAGEMIPLQAAVKGARDFAEWASSQGCTTRLLVDEGDKRVLVTQIFDAVNDVVQAATYDQLTIYFSGHGILTAPNTEFWLLSGAPQNPNEAVNLSLSVAHARNSGIPHVIFISDACRSAVKGPPLSGIVGGVIFPNSAIRPQQAEIDVFYATRPGDPAWEVPEAEATQRYRGIFTDSLLKVLHKPKNELQDSLTLGPPPVSVITSRRLKSYLEVQVPLDAGFADVRLRQQPEVRVESALPKYFATASAPVSNVRSARKLTWTAPSVLGTASLRKQEFDFEVSQLLSMHERPQFEMHTGFTVFGAEVLSATAQNWTVEQPFVNLYDQQARQLRLSANGTDVEKTSPLLLEFGDGTGILLAILPKFIGTVVVKGNRVVSVNYVPSVKSWRYDDYLVRADELERMKATAAVASRQGQFIVDSQDFESLADKIRQLKGIDPTMGLYAAYSYAQGGKYKEVASVFDYMNRNSYEIPVPFDVAMLAFQYPEQREQNSIRRIAPFAPLLSQGWPLLTPGHPLYRPIHGQLRSHLVPSLWTTYTADGVIILKQALLNNGGL